MYKIKPNGNYNLIIADLNVTLCSNSDVILTDLEFESSNDIKNILHYLDVQKIDSNEYQEVDVIKEEVTDNIPVAFVAHSYEVSNDKGFFVRDTESTEVINVDKTIEETEVTVETTVTDTVDTSIETVCDNVVETNTMETNTVETIISTETIETEIPTLKNEEKKVAKSNVEKKAKKETAKSKKISSKKKDNTVQ